MKNFKPSTWVISLAGVAVATIWAYHQWKGDAPLNRLDVARQCQAERDALQSSLPKQPTIRQIEITWQERRYLCRWDKDGKFEGATPLEKIPQTK